MKINLDDVGFEGMGMDSNPQDKFLTHEKVIGQVVGLPL